MYAYLDEDWPAYQKALTCVERAAMARKSTQIEIVDEKNGPGEGFVFDESFTHSVRTHYWYFVVADCTLEEVRTGQRADETGRRVCVCVCVCVCRKGA
jgi:hypothetical protein